MMGTPHHRPRRPRRHLTDAELDALREIAHGRPPSNMSAYAALIAALSAALSALTTLIFAIIDHVTR